MPAVPYGWYAVLRSAELRPDRVVSLHYFGRALVAFRGSDGQAAVRDAHCPHYGAHLGVGGKVVDGTVECPFHGWRFGADGRCVNAPFAVRTPKVSLGGFPVREHSGLVFVYVGPTEPPWEVPEIPEAGARDFAEPIDDTCRARVHVQEMRENIVDESHFHFIHGQSEPPVQDWRTDGPFAEVRGRISRRVLGWDIDNTFDAFMYGPGVMVVRTHGPVLSVTAVALSTPVDDRTSELRMLLLPPQTGPRPVPDARAQARLPRGSPGRGAGGGPDLGSQDPPAAPGPASARKGHQSTAPLVRPVLSVRPSGRAVARPHLTRRDRGRRSDGQQRVFRFGVTGSGRAPPGSDRQPLKWSACGLCLDRVSRGRWISVFPPAVGSPGGQRDFVAVPGRVPVRTVRTGTARAGG